MSEYSDDNYDDDPEAEVSEPVLEGSFPSNPTAYYNQPNMAVVLINQGFKPLGPYNNNTQCWLRRPGSGEVFKFAIKRDENNKPNLEWFNGLVELYATKWGGRSGGSSEGLETYVDTGAGDTELTAARYGMRQAGHNARVVSRQMYDNEALPFMIRDRDKPILKSQIDKFTWYQYITQEVGQATFLTLLQAVKIDPKSDSWLDLLNKFNTKDDLLAWFKTTLADLLKFHQGVISLDKIRMETNKYKMMYEMEMTAHKRTRDVLMIRTIDLNTAIGCMCAEDRTRYTSTNIIGQVSSLSDRELGLEGKTYQIGSQSVTEQETPLQNELAGIARDNRLQSGEGV